MAVAFDIGAENGREFALYTDRGRVSRHLCAPLAGDYAAAISRLSTVNRRDFKGKLLLVPADPLKHLGKEIFAQEQRQNLCPYTRIVAPDRGSLQRSGANPHGGVWILAQVLHPVRIYATSRGDVNLAMASGKPDFHRMRVAAFATSDGKMNKGFPVKGLQVQHQDSLTRPRTVAPGFANGAAR